MLGCIFTFVVPGFLLGPVLFDDMNITALPAWGQIIAAISAVLGLWHIATAKLALDEDIQFIISYASAQDAAPLVLPFVLFMGTRSMYRRLFAPAFVAKRRWQARRDDRLLREVDAKRSSVEADVFKNTLPLEP